MLSHGAIVAREFGIPCVVGVANATRELSNADKSKSTAIKEKFMSSIRLLHAYWRERYPLRIFLPFTILIAAAGIAAEGSLPTIRAAAIGCILAYTLVLVFRIADDLVDLDNDRLHHPVRVLVQASSVTSIVVFAFVIAIGDITIITCSLDPVSDSRPSVQFHSSWDSGTTSERDFT
jgi:hypothetical protein